MSQSAKTRFDQELEELLRVIPDDGKILDISEVQWEAPTKTPAPAPAPKATTALTTAPASSPTPTPTPMPTPTPAKSTGPPQKPKPAEQAKREKGKKILFIFSTAILCGCLALILSTLGVFATQGEPAAPVLVGDIFPGSGDALDGTLSNMTKEDIRAQMQLNADANYFSFKINTRWELEDGSSKANVGIENPNYNVYPMVVQVFLGEDGLGDIIFDSGGILPNQHIDEASLKIPLQSGVYNALAQLYAYDPDTRVNIFKSSASILINVRN